MAEARLHQLRYKVACAAALAAAGRDRIEPTPDDATRARLRGQSLDCLTAELTAWSDVLDSGDPQARAAVTPTLRQWQQDPGLAVVREPDALAALPGSERSDWESIWDAVGALLAESEAIP